MSYAELLALAKRLNRKVKRLKAELQRERETGGFNRQKPLFAGLDCLPGQQDLFATDGES